MNRPFCDTRVPAVGSVRRFFTCLAGTLAALIIVQSALAAFPVDPVRIFARDQSPAAGRLEVEASVWQGGAPTRPGDGKIIYRETRTVETEPNGRYDFWLDDELAAEGKLRGSAFGLDHKLSLELKYNAPGVAEPVHRRYALFPIDGAYVATRAERPRPNGGPAAPRFDKAYDPQFAQVQPDHVRRGQVVLYPDGRLQTEDGSFLETAGTTTSGVQEFFDYCSEHHVDGYIVGGSIPGAQQVVYRIWSPLRMHPAQGIRIDTGAITLKFMPDLGTAPGLTIDSCMMNDIRIRGLLHYQAEGYALAVNPANPLPLDRFVGNTIVDSHIYITSIACRDAQGAVLMDGSINYTRFEFNEINHGDVGIHVANSAGFSNNRITCKHVHGQTEASILDEGGAKNIWEVNLNCDGQDPLGIVTAGRDNIWFSNIESRNRPSVTLRPAAEGNQFFLMGMSGGFDNQAAQPTNRFFPSLSINPANSQLGYATATPPVPASGQLVVNRNPFNVAVMVKDPGSVEQWELNDAFGDAEKFDGRMAAGQNVLLGPGEAIRLHYNGAAPAWRWRGIP